MAQNDLWAVWKSILEQMDRAKAPSPGMCAVCNAKSKAEGHILCEPCRVHSRGYPFARKAA
jgi:hypothetical protein